MKKTILLFLSVLSLLLTSCATTKTEKSYKKLEAGQAIITNIDKEEGAVKYGQNVDGFTDVTIVDCSKSKNRNLVTVDLADFEEFDMDFDFSCDLKITSDKENEFDIIWMVNELNAGFPELARIKVKNGEWTHFQGAKSIALSGKRQFYISAAGINKEDLKLYIKNFNLKLSCDDIGKEKKAKINWADERSLAQAYAPYFDYIGFATPKALLQNGQAIKGLEHQGSCFTMENEFKPDFMFAWQKPSKLKDFTGEDGKTYKVPENTPVLENIGTILKIAKYTNLKMRGHVLVWHAQTPDWFFRENYGSNTAKYVSQDEMNARMEWYIKTVLEHVTEWEKKNNNGEHMILAWDVVNEAASDNSTETNYLRDASSSKWFAVYKDVTFIVNAFRYANKYAPKDVKLVYNDYGCASPNKNKAICKIIDAIQAAPDARIDAAGMQTHISINDSAVNFEKAVKNFLAKGINVQITEMDVANGASSYNAMKLKDCYRTYFKMFIANRKQPGKNGIEGVTLWGVRDEWTWLNSMHKGHTQYPLLFNDKNFYCKPAYYGVIEAAEESK